MARGHRVTLITGACAPAHRPDGAQTLALSEKRSSSVLRLRAFARWAKRQLREWGFDTSLSVTMAAPARIVQPRGGTLDEIVARSVARRGGGWRGLGKACVMRFEPKLRLLAKLERQTLADPGVYRVAALGDYVVRQLQEHHGFDPQRVVVIPNGSLMPRADDAQKAAWRAAVRRAHGVPGEAYALLLPAFNPDLKGYPTLLNALERLASEGLRPVVFLAGGFGDRQLAQARRRGLEAQIRRAVPDADSGMAALYAAADVTVLPSWYDPSSKVVIESLMMSTPAISTVYDGSSGWVAPPSGPPRGVVLADPGDAGALTGAIRRLADPALRAGCAAACAGLGDELSMARHVDRLERLLADAGAGAAV